MSSIITDIETTIKSIDELAEEYMTEASFLINTRFTNYQIFINILFLLIILGIFYLLYRDYIFRIASKMTRCADINEIININIDTNENSYIYNIYIVHVNNTNNVAKDFILKLEYNFLTEETNIIFGEYKYISRVLFSPTDNINILSNAFYIFDLAEKKQKFIDYYDKESDKVYYIDRKKMATKHYKYYITSSIDKKLTDDSSIKLANFVKRYAYNDNTNLDPVYNILYAIENKKNMEY